MNFYLINLTGLCLNASFHRRQVVLKNPNPLGLRCPTGEKLEYSRAGLCLSGHKFTPSPKALFLGSFAAKVLKGRDRRPLLPNP